MHHRNIVQAREYSEDDKFYSLMMEYCNDASYFEEKIDNVRKVYSLITQI